MNLTDSILIGDHSTDLEAARRAGCRSLLVLSGLTRDWAAAQVPEGCIAVLPDLLSAAHYIVAQAP